MFGWTHARLPDFNHFGFLAEIIENTLVHKITQVEVTEFVTLIQKDPPSNTHKWGLRNFADIMAGRYAHHLKVIFGF